MTVAMKRPTKRGSLHLIWLHGNKANAALIKSECELSNALVSGGSICTVRARTAKEKCISFQVRCL